MLKFQQLLLKRCLYRGSFADDCKDAGAAS
jgi:hypothetical protein